MIEVPRDPASFLADFGRCAAGLGFRAATVGSGASGPILAWERGGPGLRIYLSAGIHGDEPAGPLALLEWMRAGGPQPQAAWAVCPLLNPAGWAEGRRDNAEGIDLNRDYLKQASTEVRAHAAWLSARPAPDLFLSLHEDWETMGFYFYEINQGADDPLRARALLAAAAAHLPVEPEPIVDEHAVREPGWIDHVPEADLPGDWPEAIFLAKRGCPLSFTFETPSRLALETRVAAHLAATRRALDWFLGGDGTRPD